MTKSLDAERIFEMWHQKPVRRELTGKFEWPRTVAKIGWATRIIYQSGKWEARKKYNYDHTFSSGVVVYGDLGSHASKSVGSLLRTRNLDGEFTLPILGKTRELTYYDGEQVCRVTFSSHHPYLCCTGDRRTLIVFSDDGVLLLRGGKMIVTERGIVN